MNREEPGRGAQPKGGATGVKDEAGAKCMSCGADSRSRPLLGCLVKGESKWVCVRCLPMLIHGSE